MMQSMACRWHRRRVVRGRMAPGDGATWSHRHVRSCAHCRRALADADLVAGELARIELPEPSSACLWRHIESRLDRAAVAAAAGERGASERRPPRRLAAAVGWVVDEAPTWAVAVVAVVALLGVWQARDWAASRAPSRATAESDAGSFGDGGLRLAMVPVSLDVGSYVAEVSRSASPDEFWDAYRARAPEPDDPYRDLTFQPLVPEELPHGFRVVDSKLLRDACCETLQVRYRADGRWLDIFQCHYDHPIEFGRASVDRREVSGIVCTAFGWSPGEIRGRSFLLGQLSLVVVGNVSDEVLDDIVAEMGSR